MFHDQVPHEQAPTNRNVNRATVRVLVLFLLAGLGLWFGGRALAARDSAAAATCTVCASGCDYSSIQAAIDGDTLMLLCNESNKLRFSYRCSSVFSCCFESILA